VNPHDVLQSLRADAESLWAPRARTKKLHELKAERRRLREQRARLEEIAEQFRNDRVQRESISQEIQSVDGSLRSSRHRHARLAALLENARHLFERAREDERAREAQDESLQRIRAEMAAIEVDGELLERASAVERLAARLELFRSEAEQALRDEERLRQTNAEIDRRLAELGEGWDLEKLLGVDLGVETEGQLHEQEEVLLEARRRRDDARRLALEARSERLAAHQAAEERSREVEISGIERPLEALAARLDAVDRLLALGRGIEARWPSLFPAMAASVVALTLLGAGLVLDEPLLAWAAVPPGALALGLLLWAVVRRRVPEEVAGLLTVLELDRAPSTAELVEIRGRMEDSHRAWLTAESSDRAAAARELAADEADEAFAAATREWKRWLSERGLGAASSWSGGALRVAQTVRDVRGLVESRRAIEDDLERRRETCTSFVADAAAVDPEFELTAGDEAVVAHRAEMLVARLEAARRAAERVRDLEREEKLALEARDQAARRVERAQAEMREVFEQAALDRDQAMPDLEAAEAVAREELAELEGRRVELLEARGTLDGRLQRGASESASSELRLQQAGLEERLHEALEAYAVRSIAVDMLEQALETFEAERQPAVIQRAQEIFSSLTEGRYTRIATPLGRFEPTVSGGGVVGRSPDKLSRATAEQLFLALRLSYIENLAAAHEALPVLMDDVLVNFDSRRCLAAAKTIGDFASRRQVVFFTCHPRTVEAFRQQVAGCAVIEMESPLAS
jgi:uncharacterized protein YhaN